MSYRTADDWLKWAQAKYDAAQERYAWMEHPRSDTMDSYAELISLIEAGMASRAGRRKQHDGNRLSALADQMETLGKGGFSFNPQSMIDAAHQIRTAINE